MYKVLSFVTFFAWGVPLSALTSFGNVLVWSSNLSNLFLFVFVFKIRALFGLTSNSSCVVNFHSYLKFKFFLPTLYCAKCSRINPACKVHIILVIVYTMAIHSIPPYARLIYSKPFGKPRLILFLHINMQVLVAKVKKPNRQSSSASYLIGGWWYIVLNFNPMIITVGYDKQFWADTVCPSVYRIF